MASTGSVIIVKRFTYRGNLEEWSNRYYLTGTMPTTDVGWDGLFSAIHTSEKTCYPATHSIVREYGYVAGNDIAQRVRDLSTTPVAGTMATTGGAEAPGDAAAVLRMTTTKLTTKGRHVYLRKFFHGAIHTTGAPDTLLPAQKTALEAHGAFMIGGTLSGSAKWSAEDGTAGVTAQALPYVMYRQLRKGHRRPPS